MSVLLTTFPAIPEWSRTVILIIYFVPLMPNLPEPPFVSFLLILSLPSPLKSSCALSLCTETNRLQASFKPLQIWRLLYLEPAKSTRSQFTKFFWHHSPPSLKRTQDLSYPEKTRHNSTSTRLIRLSSVTEMTLLPLPRRGFPVLCLRSARCAPVPQTFFKTKISGSSQLSEYQTIRTKIDRIRNQDRIRVAVHVNWFPEKVRPDWDGLDTYREGMVNISVRGWWG